MRYFLSIIIFLFGSYLFVQDQGDELQSKIDFFNSKIKQTDKAERLILMDSLTRLTYRNPEYKYDSIVRQTIKLAIDLDSLSLAANQVKDLIDFYNNFLGKPEEGLKLFNTYIDKLKDGADYKSVGRIYLNAADSYYYTGNIDKSYDYYSITKDYALKAKDQQLYGLATMYTGYNQSETGKFAEASQSLKEASQIFTRLKDTSNSVAAKNSLAILYSKNAFYDEAEKVRNEAISLIGNTSRYITLSNLYYNASVDYDRKGDIEKQLVNIKAAFLANSKTNNAFLRKPYFLVQLIAAYCKNDSLVIAEKYFQDLNTLYLEKKSPELREKYLKAKSILSFTKGDYEEAVKYGNEFLNILINKKVYSIEEISLAEQFLASVYEVKGDTENYNKHLLKHYQLKDSISNIQNVKSLAYYQTLYETEKRDLEIERQKASISQLDFENKTKTQLLIFSSLGLLVLFGSIMVYRSFLSAKKREQTHQEFSQELIKTQEKDRIRIAKELHDSVGQQITLLKMKAQNTDQVVLSELAHNALEEVRSISRNLYPITLTKLGLTDSIEQLLLDLDEESDLFVSVEIDDVNTNFDRTESLNFYRFIQESVNNVLKHAKAKTLIVSINKQKDGIKVLIKDNGQGFEVKEMIKQNSLGLKTMAERISMLKGNLSIKSKPGKGTSLLVHIPVYK
ncbi:sensor histidine kinase [Winogradskyella sp. PG-2]|uniref:sensor histidine kinase n=1 Tax=Winogradskyella sp. PG-2 TaxID=754409 RepID=UPI0004588FEA|nr:sensor histidine kinase [Winogradskyella sp. PG-2]BAO74697.1 hypothetical protein WPG_0467 [Winogradskyella sp. PG-2]